MTYRIVSSSGTPASLLATIGENGDSLHEHRCTSPRLHPPPQTDSFTGMEASFSGLTLSLAGKVALVTGGSRGIGAATVRLLRQAGARVVFSYRSAEKQANALVTECGGESVCRAVQQELVSVEDGQALIAA